MKILKNILGVYLILLILAVSAIFLLFPVFLSVYFKDEAYYFLFIFNLPVFFGLMFTFIDGETTNRRPKR